MKTGFRKLFENHTVYITIDDKIFKLHGEDLEKEEVSEIPVPTRDNPTMILHKLQFDVVKTYLMNAEHPFRMKLSTAELYRQIGFLSDEEFEEYKNKIDSFMETPMQEAHDKEFRHE